MRLRAIITITRFRHSRSSPCLFLAAAQETSMSQDSIDPKSDSKFASHLKTSTAMSSFARSRTLREQREYLPAFACREDLMRAIRDNQGTCRGPIGHKGE